LNACVRSASLVKAKEVFIEMKQSNISCNAFIASTMIKAYTKARDLPSALTIYESIQKDETVVNNIVVYNAILDCCVQCGDYETMHKIYKDLKRKTSTSKVLADLITYSTLIKGYAKSKNVAKMMKIYDFLKEKEEKNEIQLDEVLYNTLLDGCLKNNEESKAFEIIAEMRRKKIAFSNVSYSILIRLHSKRNNNEKVFEAFEEMKREKIVPGLVVYTCIIQNCIRSKDMRKALELFEAMKKQGITPDYVVYSTIINGCLYNKKCEVAHKYIVESVCNNIRLPLNLYDKYFERMMSNYNTLKESVKLDCCEKLYGLLKEKRVNISEDILGKLAKFVSKTKGIQSNPFKRKSV